MVSEESRRFVLEIEKKPERKLPNRGTQRWAGRRYPGRFGRRIWCQSCSAAGARPRGASGARPSDAPTGRRRAGIAPRISSTAGLFWPAGETQAIAPARRTARRPGRPDQSIGAQSPASSPAHRAAAGPRHARRPASAHRDPAGTRRCAPGRPPSSGQRAAGCTSQGRSNRGRSQATTPAKQYSAHRPRRARRR